MTVLDRAEARDLAEQFYRLSKELGDYRFSHWDELDKSERLAMESVEWSLLNATSDLTAAAIGLAVDDLKPVAKRIAASTTKMKAAIKRTRRAKDVLTIAAAAVELCAAIVSGNPTAIASALERAIEASS